MGIAHDQRLDHTRWRRTASIVIARDKECMQCGSTTDLTADHLFPLSLMTEDQWDEGLPYDADECITLCRKHNSKKGNKVTTRVTWFNKLYFTKT